MLFCKKFSALALAITMIVATINVSGVSAAEVEQGEITIFKEDEGGGPNGKVIHVGKPIANKGYISNTNLGKIIDKRNSDVKWLEVLTWGSSFINLPGAAIDSLALTLANDSSLTQMEKAYAQGKSLYWAEVYADGNEGSLSKQAHVYYSKKSLNLIK